MNDDLTKEEPFAWAYLPANDTKWHLSFKCPLFAVKAEPLYQHSPQTKPLKRLNKQEIARYMFSQNTGQDIGQMLIEYFCDKNGLTLEYIED